MRSTERRLLRREELLVDLGERGTCEKCAHFAPTSAGFGKCVRGTRDIDARRGEWCAKFEHRAHAPMFDREAVIAAAKADAEKGRQERSEKIAATKWWAARSEALGLEVDKITRATRERYGLDRPAETIG